MTKAGDNESGLITPREFNDVGNRSMVKDLQDLLEGIPDPAVMSKEDVERWRRIARRMASAARSNMDSYRHRSALAEQVYDIQQEEDYKILHDPETGKAYANWTEFRIRLSAALGISTGTIGRYISLVRYGRQVLRMKPGQFAHENGLVHVKHMVEVSAGTDGRSSYDLRETVRARTGDFAAVLDSRYPETEPADQLWQYYQDEVRPDYEDPSAILKTPAELGAQAKQVTGAPDIWPRRKYGTRGWYELHLRYPDHILESTGEIITGHQETYDLKVENDLVPDVLLDWLEGRLGLK